MYKMTDNERTTLYRGMVDLLDEYGYNYTEHALNSIIDKWCENKAGLIEAFKNHPNYIDGKFLIAFESDYEREIDNAAIRDFGKWVRDHLISDPSCVANVPDEVKNIRAERCWLPYEMFDLIYYHISQLKNRTINEETTNYINRVMPNIKAHNGEKTSRVVNRIFTYLNYNKHPEYNKRYAKYADALTPITIKRHTILSLNPLDYLTMSFGNSWSSCHTIDKQNKRDMPNTYEGQYSSGTMSYLLDGVSMVYYTVDSKYDGNDFFTQPKINRQMYHYGEDKLVQGRLYPQSNDGCDEIYAQYRSVVQDIISTIFNFPNLWIKKNSGIRDWVDSEGTHYRDYYNFDECNLTIVKASENDKSITIGHTPICVECGEYHDESECINCCHGIGGYYCADCGEWVDEDDAYYIDGEYYCRDCVSYCEYCHEYYRNSDVHYISGYGEVCDSCLEWSFTICDECGDYTHNDDITRIEVDGESVYVCEYCLEDKYERCCKCDEYHPQNEMIYDEDGDRWYCKECHKENEKSDHICERCGCVCDENTIKNAVDNYGNSHHFCSDCLEIFNDEMEQIAIENERAGVI